MTIKLDMIEGDFLAVGADMPEDTLGDFDDLGRHRYCADCPDFWTCHQMMRCGLDLKARGRF